MPRDLCVLLRRLDRLVAHRIVCAYYITIADKNIDQIIDQIIACFLCCSTSKLIHSFSSIGSSNKHKAVTRLNTVPHNESGIVTNPSVEDVGVILGRRLRLLLG